MSAKKRGKSNGRLKPIEVENLKKLLLSCQRQISQQQQGNGHQIMVDDQPRQHEDAAEDCDTVVGQFTAAVLLTHDSQTQKLIDLALDKIDGNLPDVFGNCEQCGSFIGKRRLSAIPWAPLCCSCQSTAEKTH